MFRFCTVDTYGLTAQVQGNPCKMYSTARDWGVVRTGLGIKNEHWDRSVMDACGFSSGGKWVYIHCREERPGFVDDQLQAFRTYHHATMRASIDWIGSLGYRVVLQGFPPLEYQHTAGFSIDSHTGCSFDLQLALLAGASAFIGSTSGLFHLASFFDVPCILTNVVPADTGPLTARDWGISKRLFDTELSRHISVEEMLNLSWSSTILGGLRSGRYVLVDNTDEEILSLCKEAFEAIGSGLPYQSSRATVYYRSLFSPINAAYPYNANIGTDFLVANSQNFKSTE